MKRILISIIFFFIIFMLLYTWNDRTNHLDKVTTYIGLEVTGFVLKPVESLISLFESTWDNYIYLTNVKEENIQLKKKINKLEYQLTQENENRAELKRLREFFEIKIPKNWYKVVARVIAGRLGAFSTMETILLDKGYMTGATVGKPIMAHNAIIGYIYQASAYTSIALLIEDFGSKIAVISSKGRVHGILSGAGRGKLLEIRFVDQNAKLEAGETLYTSGLDLGFPKGIPIATVAAEQPLTSAAFQIYYAKPLARLHHLEEVLILFPPSEQAFPSQKEIFNQGRNKEEFSKLNKIKEANPS